MNKTTRTLLASATILLGTAGMTGVALAESPANDGLQLQTQFQDDTITEDGEDSVDTDAGEDAEDGERRNRGRRGNGRKLAVVAETIGIEVDELREGLSEDQSIADVAEANGVAAQDVIDAMIDRIEEKLDAKVADGDLTEEEAAEKLASKTERIEDRVNGVERTDNDTDTEEATA